MALPHPSVLYGNQVTGMYMYLSSNQEAAKEEQEKLRKLWDEAVTLAKETGSFSLTWKSLGYIRDVSRAYQGPKMPCCHAQGCPLPAPASFDRTSSSSRRATGGT
jgi:hypothetical protein